MGANVPVPDVWPGPPGLAEGPPRLAAGCVVPVAATPEPAQALRSASATSASHIGRHLIDGSYWLEAPDCLVEQSLRNPDGFGLGTFAPEVVKGAVAAHEVDNRRHHERVVLSSVLSADYGFGITIFCPIAILLGFVMLGFAARSAFSDTLKRAAMTFSVSPALTT